MRKRMGRALLGLFAAGAGVYVYLRNRSQPVSNHPYLKKDGLLVMAHQGGMGLWPANTMYAFERATSLGVDALEMDVQMSADGVLVVRHDEVVDSTTNGRGLINGLTLAEIKALDAGYTWTADGGETFPYRDQGITIPTLEEVLQAFPDMRLNIDLKPPDPAVVEPFCRLLRAYDCLERVLVGSFHDYQLYRFRQLCPQAATAAGVEETRLFYQLNRAFLGRIYQPRAHAFQVPESYANLRLVTRRFVDEAHRHNMQVHVWTVNEIEAMQRLIDIGVDGLISDFPDRLLALLGR